MVNVNIQSGELAVVNSELSLSDITQLPSYETSNPDFIFTDIQGKGRLEISERLL